MSQRTMEEYREQIHETDTPQVDMAWWIKQGALGGLLAGVVFALFEILVALFTLGPEAVFVPLRMAAAIVLGPAALEPDYAAFSAIVAGGLLHLALSIFYGIVFAALASFGPAIGRSSWMIVVAASLFGLVLWLVNFYAIAPVAGWNWFPELTNPIVQFIAHTFFYGTVLGLFLQLMAIRHPRRS